MSARTAPHDGGWGQREPTGVRIYSELSTPDSMREAAAELLKLADWFAERPVKP